MSDNKDLNPFLQPSSWQGSQNAGTWQANIGQPCSGQQSHESATSYATRVNAYNYAKNGQNG